MKEKLPLVLLILFLLVIPNLVYSQSFDLKPVSYESVNIIEINESCVNGLGNSYSSNGRSFPRAWAIVLNIIPGFGLGSYLQGNNFAGNIQLTTSIVGFTVGGILVTYGMVAKNTTNGSLLKGHEIWLGWTIMGVGIGGGIIYGIIAAVLYKPNQQRSNKSVNNDSNKSVNSSNGNSNDEKNNNTDDNTNIDTSVFFTSSGIGLKVSF